MHILVHSPWLPGYISVLQTIHVMLTIAGLFFNIPRIMNHYLLSLLLNLEGKTKNNMLPLSLRNEHLPWRENYVRR